MQIEAAADTAVVLQIGVRLTRYCPCLAVRFPAQPEAGDGCQSQISLQHSQAADGGRTRDLKLGKRPSCKLRKAAITHKQWDCGLLLTCVHVSQ